MFVDKSSVVLTDKLRSDIGLLRKFLVLEISDVPKQTLGKPTIHNQLKKTLT